MNYHADAVGPVKTNRNGGNYFTVKCGSTWYNVDGDEEQRQRLSNRNFSGAVKPSANPKYNGWMSVVAIEEDAPKAPPTPQSGNGWPAAEDTPTAPPKPATGAIPCGEWMSAMREFHKLAAELEPDELSEHRVEAETTGEPHTVPLVIVDRSAARAAILNTCMIALSNRRIDMTDDVSPF